jgi:hypothetical protein
MNRRRKIHRPHHDEDDPNRKNFLMEDSYMKSYVDLLPKPDEMSNIVYWS